VAGVAGWRFLLARRGLGCCGITVQKLTFRVNDDDLPATGAWPAWCTSAARTTDAHLVGLTERHGCVLATLDEGIPGAFLVPVY
jgi:hypothetical protein